MNRLSTLSIAGVLESGILIAAATPSAPALADTEVTEINIEHDRTTHRTRLQIENEFIDRKAGGALITLTFQRSSRAKRIAALGKRKSSSPHRQEAGDIGS